MALIDAFVEVFTYLANPTTLPSPFYEIWWWVRAGFLVFTTFLVVLLAYVYSVSEYRFYRFYETSSEYRDFKPDWGIKIDKNWEEVKKKASHEKEAERKLAVIEADDIINSAFEQIGYTGSDLIEKLDGLNKDIVPLIEELKEAHRIKRDLVYDPNRSMSKEEAERIVSYYDATIKDMQIL